MKDSRPVNLDLRTIRLPLTAISSITHRITGIILFVAIGFMLFALDLSLSSPEGYARVEALLGHPLSKLVTWGILSALVYHMIAGVRHLLMDAGMGETLEGGLLGARIVIVLSVISVLLLGVAIW
jgi:succinate dehydrogenase / fumarate reductase cytochrome b subunit